MRVPERAVVNVSMRPERIERFDAERAEMVLVHGDHHQLAHFGHAATARKSVAVVLKRVFCELTYIADSNTIAGEFRRVSDVVPAAVT